MQLISCTTCHRTWEHVEEPLPYPYTTDRDWVFIEHHHHTPCFHHYDVEVSLPQKKASVFTETVYHPTFQNTIDIELAAELIRKIGDRSLISFYHDLLEEYPIETNTPPSGEGWYLEETISYHGQDILHLSYFESETFQVFTAAQLGIISYLHRKNPARVYEILQEWVKRQPDFFVLVGEEESE